MQQALPHQQQWLSLAQLSPGWAAVLVVACVVTLTSRHSCINTLYLSSAWVRLQDTEQHLQAEERELLPHMEQTLSHEQLMRLGRAFEWAKLIAPSR